MNQEQFEQTVKQLVNNDEKWLHVLPAVPEQLRQRFVKILETGVSIPKAYDLVLVTNTMTDEDFSRRLRQTLNRQ